MKGVYLLLAFFLFLPTTLLAQCNELSVSKNPFLNNFKKDRVCWKSWTEKNLNLAKRRKKLIFLRVVRTGCEACVKLSNEIYRNKDIAFLLNKNFINILVDHSTQPEIANFYNSFLSKPNEKLNFPINIFLTSDRKGFLKAKALDGNNLKNLITRIINSYSNNPKSIIDSANYFFSSVKNNNNYGNEFSEERISKAATKNLNSIKNISTEDLLSVPIIQRINFLIDYDYYQRKKSESDEDKDIAEEQETLLEIVKNKLKELSYSKYYDHVEGGFFLPNSYSKSLLLNAELSLLYAKVFKVTNQALFENVAREILDYTIAYFSSKNGGFFDLVTPFDKDLNSDYHFFPSEMLANLLSGLEFGTLRKHFNLEKIGSAYKLSLKEDKSWDIKYDLNFFKIIQKLVAFRKDKGFPVRDEKQILLSNARMIEALSYGYQTFGESRYLLASKLAATYSYSTFYRNNTLKRYSINDRIYEDALLDDYVTLISSFLSLFKSTSNLKWYATAIKFSNLQEKIFWDKDKYAYFYSNRASLPKFVKLFTSVDFIAPNSFALANLYSLYNLNGKPKYLDQANKLVSYFQSEYGNKLENSPEFLSALFRNLNQVTKVVLIKGVNELVFNSFKEVLFQGFYPDKELISVYSFSNKKELSKINTLLKITRGLSPKEGLSTAYLCKESSGKIICKAPITSVKKLITALDS